jgi:hypothetical protein
VDKELILLLQPSQVRAALKVQASRPLQAVNLAALVRVELEMQLPLALEQQIKATQVVLVLIQVNLAVVAVVALAQ